MGYALLAKLSWKLWLETGKISSSRSRESTCYPNYFHRHFLYIATNAYAIHRLQRLQTEGNVEYLQCASLCIHFGTSNIAFGLLCCEADWYYLGEVGSFGQLKYTLSNFKALFVLSAAIRPAEHRYNHTYLSVAWNKAHLNFYDRHAWVYIRRGGASPWWDWFVH